MEYFMYAQLFILWVSLVAVMLIALCGRRDKEGCAEANDVRTLEALRHAA